VLTVQQAMLTKEALAGELPGAFHTMTHHREQAKATPPSAATLSSRPGTSRASSRSATGSRTRTP
jgi:hypothetical protein